MCNLNVYVLGVCSEICPIKSAKVKESEVDITVKCIIQTHKGLIVIFMSG